MTEITKIKVNEKREILVTDPRSGVTIQFPDKPITCIQAEVSERWVFNVLVPKKLCAQLVPVSFLEPTLIGGEAVLSLCAIFMRHAAPDWWPLALSPGSHNCALRVACTDRRTGEDVVWVDTRYTDSSYGWLLKRLGFPAIEQQLTLTRTADKAGETIDLGTIDQAIHVHSFPGQTRSQVFGAATDFDAYFGAGIRSYGPTETPGRYAVVDLLKESNNTFTAMQAAGWLVTPEGRWPLDSVFRTVNGEYKWHFHGYLTDAD